MRLEFLRPPDGKTPLERVMRTLLLLAVFGGAIVFYQRHFETVVDETLKRGAVYDQTETLTKGQREVVAEYSRRLKAEYGLEIRLLISKEDFQPPRPDPGTIFIGLCPPRARAVVIFPPLARRAVGESFVNYLNQEHFQPYFKRGEWLDGLGEALDMIREKLAGPDVSKSGNATESN